MSSRREVDPPHYFFDAHFNTCVNYYSLIRKYEPTVLLETGVYNGVATLSMLFALKENGSGTLYSIDNSINIDNPRKMDAKGDEGAVNHDRFYSRRGQSCGDSAIVPKNKRPGWIIPDELEKGWELTEGDSRDVLPGMLEELGEIDFFVHDSEHSNARMFFEFELVWNHLSQAGIMLSGHVAQNDAFETFAEERSCDHGVYDVLWDPEPHPKSCYSSRKPCRSGYLTKGEAKPT
ncbi:class I SAM-dependent methyltransferase [Halorubraceae archaeon YAN]|nr:class I SAM-dependent methyltransferase [Halorubraceae archaeon YAN]